MIEATALVSVALAGVAFGIALGVWLKELMDDRRLTIGEYLAGSALARTQADPLEMALAEADGLETLEQMLLDDPNLRLLTPDGHPAGRGLSDGPFDWNRQGDL